MDYNATLHARASKLRSLTLPRLSTRILICVCRAEATTTNFNPIGGPPPEPLTDRSRGQGARKTGRQVQHSPQATGINL